MCWAAVTIKNKTKQNKTKPKKNVIFKRFKVVDALEPLIFFKDVVSSVKGENLSFKGVANLLDFS